MFVLKNVDTPTLQHFIEDGGPRPRVSVIMPTFNRAALLQETAGMILTQTLSDLELIIVDDHSTDHTRAVAKELIRSDKRVRYYKPVRKGGITLVVNEGIALSRGKYIQICHDHDIYRPTLSEKMADILEQNPSVVFVHPGRAGADPQGNPLPPRNVSRVFRAAWRGMNPYLPDFPEMSDGHDWLRLMLRQLASPVTGLSMIRRSALEKVGLFDPEYGACSDIDMWMRLCTAGDVGFAREVLFLSRGREPGHPYGGVINWDIQDEVIRAHRKHLRLLYTGWPYVYWKCRREIEIDFSLSLSYLNCFRHRQWGNVRRGRKYLRRHGVFLSRLAGWLL